MRPIPAIALLLATTACGARAPADVDADPPQVPTASVSVEPGPALEGSWVTDTITAAEIRTVVLEAGFTREDAAQVIGRNRAFTFELRFEDGAYELHSSWDGSDVGVLEAGDYRIITGDRLLLDTGDIGDTFLFGLALRGDRFTLKLIRSTENGTAENQYVHSYFTTAYFTGHLFERSEK
jgi:hypothetical protein